MMERGHEKGKEPQCQRLLPYPSTTLLISLFAVTPVQMFVEAWTVTTEQAQENVTWEMDGGIWKQCSPPVFYIWAPTDSGISSLSVLCVFVCLLPASGGWVGLFKGIWGFAVLLFLAGSNTEFWPEFVSPFSLIHHKVRSVTRTCTNTGIICLKWATPV